VTYAEQRRATANDAQQEQLDWLYQLTEESRAQTAVLQRIAKHTGLIYGLTIAWLVILAIYFVGSIFGAFTR
jgi:hypothetical protein